MEHGGLGWPQAAARLQAVAARTGSGGAAGLGDGVAGGAAWGLAAPCIGHARRDPPCVAPRLSNHFGDVREDKKDLPRARPPAA